MALLTALVILAIAATLSAGMIWSRGLDERRTANILQGDQAFEYGLGAEAWAEQILDRDARNNPNVTALGQNWAAQLPPLPVEGGTVSGRIEDLQARFNLNNLVSATGTVNPAYVQQFQRLLTYLDLDPGLAAAVGDWLDADNVTTYPGGAEDDFYSRLNPPYAAANGPMASVSELQLVNGITPEAYAKLLPYVCVIPPLSGGTSPGQTAIDINTAPAPLIMSLAPNITADQAQGVIAARGTQGFPNIQAVGSVLNLPANPSQQGQPGSPAWGVDSQYFLLSTTVDIGTAHLTLYSLLYRANGGTLVVRRALGTF